MLPPDNPVRLAGWVTAAGLCCWLLLAAGNGLESPQRIVDGRRLATSATSAQLATWSGPATLVNAPEESSESPIIPPPPADLVAPLNDVIDELDSVAAEPLDAAPLPAERAAADLATISGNQQRLVDEIAALREQLQRDDPAVEWKPRFAALQQAMTQLAPLEPALAGVVDDLRVEIAQMRLALQAAEKPLDAEVEREVLTTKLYRLAHVRKAELQPLIEKLLTPNIGLWAASESAEEQSTAILVRDRPEVIGHVDRLIAELDRPLWNVELEVATQEIDARSGRPLAVPKVMSPASIRRDGTTFLIPESLLFPDSAAPECEEWLQPLMPNGQGPRGLDPSPASQRVIRITPRVSR